MIVLDRLFTLRVAVIGGTITIACFDTDQRNEDGTLYGHPTGHHRVTYRVTFKGKVLWTEGQMHCGVPAHQSIDGDYAKEMALSTFGLRPGDTDEEFFESYTPEQRAFAEVYGESLALEAEDRYGQAS